jgi:hypothetical protein
MKTLYDGVLWNGLRNTLVFRLRVGWNLKYHRLTWWWSSCLRLYWTPNVTLPISSPFSSSSSLSSSSSTRIRGRLGLFSYFTLSLTPFPHLIGHTTKNLFLEWPTCYVTYGVYSGKTKNDPRLETPKRLSKGLTGERKSHNDLRGLRGRKRMNIDEEDPEIIRTKMIPLTWNSFQVNIL